MIDQVEPPLAAAWPSLADATAMVPNVTSSVVIRISARALVLPLGSGCT
jgi:hypothetical protein